MWICLVLLLIAAPDLWAANPYQLGEVDYFHQSKNNEVQDNKVFDWNDVSIGPNGHISTYSPPGPVLTLLENPTQENAKAYLDWQKQKTQKIMKAQEVIEQVIKEESKS